MIQSRYKSCVEYDVNYRREDHKGDQVAASTRVNAFLHVCRVCLTRSREVRELILLREFSDLFDLLLSHASVNMYLFVYIYFVSFSEKQPHQPRAFTC